jgi:hypothetical protein
LWKTFYKSCCILQRSDYLENNANSINNLRSLKLLDNVTGDGNCGFRVISLHIYGNENQWSEVRRKMIDAIPLMGWKEQESTEMAKLLSHFEGSAPTNNWMDHENCILLAATTFRRPVVLFAPSVCSTTFFPTSFSITDFIDDPIGIYYNGSNHYQRVRLSDVNPTLLGFPCFHQSLEYKLLSDSNWRCQFMKWYSQSSLKKFNWKSIYYLKSGDLQKINYGRVAQKVKIQNFRPPHPP